MAKRSTDATDLVDCTVVHAVRHNKTQYEAGEKIVGLTLAQAEQLEAAGVVKDRVASKAKAAE